MTWEQRLREMILAGGAVATTACGGNVSNASSLDSGEASDATTGDAMSDGGGIDTFAPNFCCNADPDPCCTYENCEASLTPTCSKELACQEAGTWDAWAYACEAPTEAGQSDVLSDDAPSDAGAGGDGHD